MSHLVDELNRQFTHELYERELRVAKVSVEHIEAWRKQVWYAKRELAIALFGWLP